MKKEKFNLGRTKIIWIVFSIIIAILIFIFGFSKNVDDVIEIVLSKEKAEQLALAEIENIIITSSTNYKSININIVIDNLSVIHSYKENGVWNVFVSMEDSGDILKIIVYSKDNIQVPRLESIINDDY